MSSAAPLRRGYAPRILKNTKVLAATTELIEAHPEAPPTDTLTAINIAPSIKVPIKEKGTAVKGTAAKVTTVKGTVKVIPKPQHVASELVERSDKFEDAIALYDDKVRAKLLENKAKDTVLTTYEAAQTNNEETGHYLLDTSIFIPTTRRAFYPFIRETYASIFGLPPKDPNEKPDPAACARLMAAGQHAVEAFLYQRFVKEYIRQSSPYRGMLVYHGLGSGKTCSSIAAAEALYGVANKRIVVMTPFSLRGNFIKEISFCGFRHFSTHNHWIALPSKYMVLTVGADGKKRPMQRIGFQPHILLYAQSVLSLGDAFLDRCVKLGQSLWIPDFVKPPNFNDDTQITAAQRDQIRAQISESINNRITFINYNGVRAEKLKGWACNRDANGKTIFDDAVIVIDEVHNLVRLMQGSILPFIQERQGAKRKRKIAAEPIEPGLWKPKLCSEPSLNYSRAFLFYRLLVGARNSKIIGLSGTPLINFPEELAILSNVLGGYIDAFETVMPSNIKVVELTKILNEDPRTDYVRITPVLKGQSIFVSIFQEGYIKVLDDTGKFLGVKHSPESQESIQDIFNRIKSAAVAIGIALDPPAYRSFPRLPPDDEIFRNTFIDIHGVKNERVLKKRLTGLISYYRGSKADFMPEIIEDKVEFCEMGEYMLSKYVEARKSEIKQEEGKDKEPEDLFAIVEMFNKKKNPSSYRFRSRAICNFVFPTSITRPFPGSADAIDAETKPIHDIEIADRQSEFLDAADISERAAVEEEIDTDNKEREILAEEDAKVTEDAEDAEDTTTAIVNAIVDTVSVGAAAVIDATTGPTTEDMHTYQELIIKAMAQLSEHKGDFLNLDSDIESKRLSHYSPKLDKIIRNIGSSPGSALVYSQFKTVEGLGVLGIALEANGYDEIQADDQSLSVESAASILKGPGAVNRYITFSGEGTKEQRAMALNIFNGNFNALPKRIADVFTEADSKIEDKTQTYAALGNRHGEICKLIAITGAGAEGISLKCVRQVHIMEPYWNMVRLDQVKGRAIRICSHADLPPEERNVSIYTYVSRFSEAQRRGGEAESTIDFALLTRDNSETSDEKVYNVSMRKQKINESLLKIMKESAMDCLMNAPDNESDLSCFNTSEKDTSKPMFLPDLDADRTETDADFGTGVAALSRMRSPAEGIAADTGRTLPPPRMTRIAQVILLKGPTGEQAKYTIKLKDEAKREYYFFGLTDILQEHALGQIEKNPITDGFKGVKFYA